MNLKRIMKMLPLVCLAVLSIAAMGCYPDHNQSTFDPKGPVAEAQLVIFWWILIGGLIVTVLVEAALIYAIFKFRRKSDDEMPKQVHGNTRLEILWTVIPAIFLAVIMVPTIQTLFYAAEAPKSALPQHTLEAIGHQWWFEFRYPNPEN